MTLRTTEFGVHNLVLRMTDEIKCSQFTFLCVQGGGSETRKLAAEVDG